jgi:hypothetical protein
VESTNFRLLGVRASAHLGIYLNDVLTQNPVRVFGSGDAERGLQTSQGLGALGCEGTSRLNVRPASNRSA